MLKNIAKVVKKPKRFELQQDWEDCFRGFCVTGGTRYAADKMQKAGYGCILLFAIYAFCYLCLQIELFSS